MLAGKVIVGSAGQHEEGSKPHRYKTRTSGRLAAPLLAKTVWEGREGSFVLQHPGLLSAEGAEIEGGIVPDSGTSELRGIAGRGAIIVEDDGTHRLTLDYELTA